jgi:Flp pilus assembly CpaF family ATPase/pSer/pThr/pTyr-binding forkhead associated (FHA) protein
VKIWFNRINDSRRSVFEIEDKNEAGEYVDVEVTIGRDETNMLVLESPLVSRRHATIRRKGDLFEFENVGLNACMVGESDVGVGQTVTFESAAQIRIWPFSLSMERETVQSIDRTQIDAHVRGELANLEQRIHRQLLDRLDLVGLESSRNPERKSILLLENNIEDSCRELEVFTEENRELLNKIVGLVIRDLLTNQIILDSGENSDVISPLASNEFDVPATLIPERETELQNLLRMLREELQLDVPDDTSDKIRIVEDKASAAFPKFQRFLHDELRKYIILRALKKDLKDTVFGFGPLQDLLRVPSITEIMVISSDQIYVEANGVIERSGRRFISDQVTESVIERIVAQVGRRIDKSQPLVDARLPDGSRVNAVIPPLALSGPCLTIRRFPVDRMTVEDLINFGSLTSSAASFLRAAVVNKRNILISGGTGSGKTTMLNALSSFVPEKERIVTVEDTAELQLHQDHVVTMETRPANVEGVGAYTARDLVKNALRMRPDRLIVGECRGGEALDMLQAMNTGHDGSMTTIHANGAEEVIERLELLVMMAVELPIKAIHRQIASALDLVVQLTRLPGGHRMVSQVSEVERIDEETGELVITDIFNIQDGKTLQPTGFLPTFVDQLVDKSLLDLRFLYTDHQTIQGAVKSDEPLNLDGR